MIADYLENSEHDKYLLANGIVYHKCDDKLRFVVPHSMITNVIRVYHNDSTHCGIEIFFKSLSFEFLFFKLVPISFRHLTGEIYAEFLENDLLVLLEDVPLHEQEHLIFQHDGDPVHFSHAVREILNAYYPDR